MKKLLAVVLTTGLIGQAFAETAKEAAPVPQAEGAGVAAVATGSLNVQAVGAAIIGVSAVAAAVGSGNSSSRHGNDNTPPGTGGTTGTTGSAGTTGTH
jgi:hypothetical protein